MFYRQWIVDGTVVIDGGAPALLGYSENITDTGSQGYFTLSFTVDCFKYRNARMECIYNKSVATLKIMADNFIGKYSRVLYSFKTQYEIYIVFMNSL